METRTLGRSGISVSRLCLGTMMFGGPTDAATSERLIARAAAAGINFLDTADGYNAGKSEEVVGAAIGSNRHAWVLATKIANKVGKGPNEGGLSRKWVIQGAEACLKRLGTDYVDILYLHKEDHATPLETTVRALGDLVRAGKIRHFGVSNYRSWRIAEICRLCDQLGIDRPVVSQPYYNAMNRQPEVEQIPAAAHYGLGIFPYSPLARGVLTAKYRPGEAPEPGSRAARQDRRMLETELRPESLEIAQRIRDHATARGTSPAHFAINWVLHNRLVTGCIVGPRTEAHLEDYLAALAYRFTAEDEALVDSLVAPGHPSTPGYNDPQYPIEGRIPATS
jgi:aryl-alcohol dehydrogenase-like predicted oxidoreductase